MEHTLSLWYIPNATSFSKGALSHMTWMAFLKDVFFVMLASFGGPEAHYGVFISMFVKKRKLISEEELLEMIGMFSLVPGPSSSQTLTAIGYKVGGPILATLTFLVWALPAIIIMILTGIFLPLFRNNETLSQGLRYLTPLAIAFITYAAWSLARKVLKLPEHHLLFAALLFLTYLTLGLGGWIIPIILLLGGFFTYARARTPWFNTVKTDFKPRWPVLLLVVFIAMLNPIILSFFTIPLLETFSIFYQYGYSVIGGGQVIIPWMVQDIVFDRTWLSLADFFAGYTIDQAIPGPLFSFAGFVGTFIPQTDNFILQFISGLIAALGIFLPGILLVFFMMPVYLAYRHIPAFKSILQGVSIAAASIITLLALTQFIFLTNTLWDIWGVYLISLIVLWKQKIPPPLLVLLVILIGFLI